MDALDRSSLDEIKKCLLDIYIYIGKLDNDEITQKSLQDFADIEEVHNLCAFYYLLLHCTCNDEGEHLWLWRDRSCFKTIAPPNY
jgi:hypothetical protein